MLASLATIGGFLLGAGMLTVIPWFAGPSPGGRKSVPLLWTAAWALWILGFVIGFALFAPVLPIICITIVTVVISMSSRKQAETQQYALLALIGAATKRAMPLETAVAAFGHERGGWMRRRCREIGSDQLEPRSSAASAAIKEQLPASCHRRRSR